MKYLKKKESKIKKYMQVKIKLKEGAKLPVKGEPNSMCYDCYAYNITKRADGKIEIDLGFSATPPDGYGIRLIPRSNLTKYWWVMNNSIGIGDQDYKAEYKAIFTPIPIQYNVSSHELIFQSFPYKIGDRVVQIEIYKRNDFEFNIVDILPGNDRGGGFGSTGLK